MGQHDGADVVVVGAGTGGLTAAAYLAAAGRRVTVVDRGSGPGGHGSVFTRGGFEFDIGLHYLGSTREGTPATQPLLDPLGIDVTYLPLNPTDTVVLADGGRFEVPRGWTPSGRPCVRLFPRSAGSTSTWARSTRSTPSPCS